MEKVSTIIHIVRTWLINASTRVKIAWLRYWALQRRFRINKGVGFRKALLIFVTVIVAIYLLIGAPVFGYLVYQKHAEGTPLSIAAAIYPFPVAIVGGEVILLKSFSDRLAYLQYFSKQVNQPLPKGDELRQQVINKLVDEVVVRQYANKAGITVSNADIDAAYNKIVSDQGSEQAIQTTLAQLYNLSSPEFKRLIPDQLYQEKVQNTLLDRVRVKHILLPTQDAANKVKAEVTKDNWTAEAKQYSQDVTTRDNGGDMGYFDVGTADQLDPALGKAFFTVTPNTISGPIQSKYGWHIIMTSERSGTIAMTFDQWVASNEKTASIHRILK